MPHSRCLLLLVVGMNPLSLKQQKYQRCETATSLNHERGLSRVEVVSCQQNVLYHLYLCVFLYSEKGTEMELIRSRLSCLIKGLICCLDVYIGIEMQLV